MNEKYLSTNLSTQTPYKANENSFAINLKTVKMKRKCMKPLNYTMAKKSIPNSGNVKKDAEAISIY